MHEITLSDALSFAHGAKKAISEGYDVPMMMLAAARLADELDNIKARAEAAKEELRKAREQEPVAWNCGGDITQNNEYAVWFRAFTCKEAAPLYAYPKPAVPEATCNDNLQVHREWREMLEFLISQRGKAGHWHRRPGIWDDDNGVLAGKPCEVCAMYDRARDLLGEKP